MQVYAELEGDHPMPHKPHFLLSVIIPFFLCVKDLSVTFIVSEVMKPCSIGIYYRLSISGIRSFTMEEIFLNSDFILRRGDEHRTLF